PFSSNNVYFLLLVCHDWNDAHATKILNKLVPAMEKSARFVLDQHVLPGCGGIHARSMDMQMFFLSNGSERQLDGWKRLVACAHPRLHVANVMAPVGS
ncbi:hypothetical protein B0J12DRAFT_564337, partial [Macrophomina phaseolina]